MGNQNQLLQKVAAGAIGGFVTAVGVDLHAWQNDNYAFSWAKTFNWPLAIKRWAYGAFAGALVGLGLGQ